MAVFGYVVSCDTDRRFRGTYCLLLMEAVSNSPVESTSAQYKVELDNHRHIWRWNWPNIAIPRNHYDGGVLNPKASYPGVSLIKDNWMIHKLIDTAVLYIGLTLSSDLLLGIDWTWEKPSSVCPYSNLPSLTISSGQASALSDPLLDIPTIFTHSLVAWCRQWVPLKRRSVSASLHSAAS
jgi:hypothetical protein